MPAAAKPGTLTGHGNLGDSGEGKWTWQDGDDRREKVIDDDGSEVIVLVYLLVLVLEPLRVANAPHIPFGV